MGDRRDWARSNDHMTPRDYQADARRIKHLAISRPMMADLFKEGTYQIVDGLPDDAEVVSYRYDEDRDLFHLTVHSGEYEIVPESSEVPDEYIEVEDVSDE